MKIWTPQELEFLQEFYPIEGIEYCCMHLKRSSASVRGKACGLKLKAPGSKLFTHEQYEDQLLEKEIEAYPIEQYVTHKTPILHACLEGHSWKAQPHNILNGHGCPKCMLTGGFNPGKPGLVYYVKIVGEETYYKIGITNNTVKHRFRYDSLHKEIITIKTWSFKLGEDAADMERALLKAHKESRVNIPGFLKGGGNTELFEYDVLGLDNANIY